MTYYGPKEMAASFRTVRGNTLKIAEEIPEDQYGFRVTPENRSVAETLVHIAIAPRLQHQIQIEERRNTLEGFDFFGTFGKLLADEKVPRSKSEILALLRSEGDKFATALEGLKEDFLGEIVQYPQGMTPPTKTRFEMLLSPKEHEMHHRAQLMVIERMLGITPHLTRQMQERIAEMQAAQAQASAKA
jgi:uncharacterized damage-inducible protein DinB